MTQNKVAVISKQLLLPFRIQYDLFKKDLLDTFHVLKESCIFILHSLIQKLLQDLSYYKSQNQGLTAILDHMKRTHSAEKNYLQIMIKEKEQQLLKLEGILKEQKNPHIITQMQKNAENEEEIDYNKETQLLKKYLNHLNENEGQASYNQFHLQQFQQLQTINEVTQSSFITEDLNLQCSWDRNTLQNDAPRNILKTITNIINRTNSQKMIEELFDCCTQKRQNYINTQYADSNYMRDQVAQHTFTKQVSSFSKKTSLISRLDSPVPNLQIIRLKSLKVNPPHTIYFDKNYKYIGKISNNLPEGFGTLYKQQILLYSGQWHQGQFSGWGQLFSFADSNIKAYHGKFSKGNPQGSGTVFYKNGGKFIGVLEKGSITGQGKYIRHDGQIVHGYWHNGNFKYILQDYQ